MDPKLDEYNYKTDHAKSILDIVNEGNTDIATPQTPKVEEKPETPQAPQTPEVPQVPEEKQVDTKKMAEELAASVTEKTEKALKESEDKMREEIKKVVESSLPQKEKEEELQKLDVKWTGQDPKTGQVTPKNYEEIVAESVRLAEERARKEFDRLYEERRVRETTEAQQKADRERQRQTEIDKQNAEFRKQAEAKIDEELEELYTEGLIKRPSTKENDPGWNDEDRNKLIQFTINLNNQRAKEGKPMIDSLSRSYHMYYSKQVKPKQPAGANAPISAGRAGEPPADTSDSYNYAKDHKKSFYELMRELVRGR